MVGHTYDNLDIEKSSAIGAGYETFYALLEHISPGYKISFADALARKLMTLSEHT